MASTMEVLHGVNSRIDISHIIVYKDSWHVLFQCSDGQKLTKKFITNSLINLF